MKPYFFLLLLMAVLFSFCTKNSSPVRGYVYNSKTNKSIEGVKVVVSNRPPVVTDASGEFYIDDFDLDKYIVDSITFNVRDPRGNYFPKTVNKIIGNKQKDPFDIDMDPVDDLEYSPQILSIGTSVSSGIINISNKGIDSMKCIISASCPWVLFGQNNIIVPPVGGFNLNIQTITTNIQCKDSCWVYIEWGNNNKDSIQIVKDILDTQKPSANFTVSDQTPNQFQSFDCDASLSNDNCSTILLYRWSFDNGINWSQPSTNPKVSYSYNVQGNQTVTVEVTDEQGNKSTYSQTVLVLLAPTPPQLNPVVSLSNGGLLCINASAILMDCGQTFTGLVDHGFVWSTSTQDPTINNTSGGDTLSLKAFNGISGNFSATICKKLQPKTYYIRAFARNGYDITYSNTFTFTLELLDYTTVTQGGSQMNFEMGNNSANEADVKPQHKVILAPFKISTSEITNAQFAVFLNSGSATALEISDFFNSPAIGQTAGMWKVEDGKENHPVVNVSWLGAKAFCTWANGRLPTEAEWECAAKEVKASPLNYTLYSGGNSLDVFGWYNANASALKEVKTRASNVLGIFDLSGNVREWCSDWYDPNYYPPGTITDPPGASSSPTGERVLRGGSFALPELPARVYYRDKRTPGTKSTDIGFRCVKN